MASAPHSTNTDENPQKWWSRRKKCLGIVYALKKFNIKKKSKLGYIHLSWSHGFLRGILDFLFYNENPPLGTGFFVSVFLWECCEAGVLVATWRTAALTVARSKQHSKCIYVVKIERSSWVKVKYQHFFTKIFWVQEITFLGKKYHSVIKLYISFKGTVSRD